jgi:hypothetical protein
LVATYTQNSSLVILRNPDPQLDLDQSSISGFNQNRPKKDIVILSIEWLAGPPPSRRVNGPTTSVACRAPGIGPYRRPPDAAVRPATAAISSRVMVEVTVSPF